VVLLSTTSGLIVIDYTKLYINF